MRPGATPEAALPSAAARLVARCDLCEHRCEVDRSIARGVCGLAAEARAYRAFLHWGEEPEISPTFAVFLTGCSFRCAYCSDSRQVDGVEEGRVVDAAWLEAAARDAAGGSPRARTLSFIGGNPDENLPALLPLLPAVRRHLPLVWNSNLYLAPHALELLLPQVDVLLPDLKFGNDACARAVARAPRYTEVLKRNLRAAHGRVRLIVRHLLMPGHVSCCLLPAARFVAEELPEATFNLLTQYEPRFAGWPLAAALARRVGRDEVEEAWAALGGLGLSDPWRDGHPAPVGHRA